MMACSECGRQICDAALIGLLGDRRICTECALRLYTDREHDFRSEVNHSETVRANTVWMTIPLSRSIIGALIVFRSICATILVGTVPLPWSLNALVDVGRWRGFRLGLIPVVLLWSTMSVVIGVLTAFLMGRRTPAYGNFPHIVSMAAGKCTLAINSQVVSAPWKEINWYEGLDAPGGLYRLIFADKDCTPLIFNVREENQLTPVICGVTAAGCEAWKVILKLAGIRPIRSPLTGRKAGGIIFSMVLAGKVIGFIGGGVGASFRGMNPAIVQNVADNWGMLGAIAGFFGSIFVLAAIINRSVRPQPLRE